MERSVPTSEESTSLPWPVAIGRSGKVGIVHARAILSHCHDGIATPATSTVVVLLEVA